ncbi:MAG: hypothetical protein ACKVRO_11990 [Micropepsaceae bacterium]
MRVAETVLASYRLLFANAGALLQVAVAWAIIAALPGAAGNLAFGVTPPDDASAGLVYLAPSLLTVIIGTAGSICLAVVWHRYVILGEPVWRFFPTTTDVIGPFLVRVIAAMVPAAIWAIFVMWMFWESEHPLQNAVMFFGASFFLALCARLLLILPATAAGNPSTTFQASWRATRHQGAALVVGLLACDLPFTAISAALDYATFDYEINSLGSIAAIAVVQVIDLARVATWTAFMSYAYLEFVRPAQVQAEQFS